MTVTDPSFLLQYWDSLVSNNENLVPVTRQLAQGLDVDGKEQRLQPGHLRHLFHQDDIQDLSFNELFRIARFDIAQLAQSLSERSVLCRNVNVALSLGSSTVKRIHSDQVNYIISDSEERPGFSDGLPIISFGNAQDPVEFPSMPEIPAMSVETIEELHFLESSGHVKTFPAGVEFRHPDYEAVSRHVLLNVQGLLVPALLEMVERALASTNEAVALQCAKAIPSIYGRFAGEPAVQRKILDIAFAAQTSIFPSIRDELTGNLISWIGDFDNSTQELILSRIHPKEYEFDDILWEGDSPWTVGSRGYLMALPDEVRVQNSDSDFLVEVLAEPSLAEGVTSKDAWIASNYLACFPETEGGLSALQHLSRHKYAFIRIKAIQNIFRSHVNSTELYEEVLHEEINQSVIFEIVKSSFCSWHIATKETREILRSWIVEQVCKVSVAKVCSDLIVDFGDEYSHHGPRWDSLSDVERRDVWGLWTEIAAYYLEAIAAHPFLHNVGRMWNSFRVAGVQLSQSAIDVLAESWVVWIEGQIQFRMLDTYGLPVAEFILRRLAKSDQRKKLLERVLNHHDTGFATTSVHFVIEYWNQLDSNEKTLLTDLLRGHRHDVCWIRARAITRESVPPEIQELITGQADLLSKLPQEILDNLDPELLSNSLHMFCGEPQPLWWYGLHHTDNSPWPAILNLIVEMPDHRNFDLALKEMLFGLIGSTQPERAKALEKWTALCAMGQEVRGRIYKHLLTNSIEVNGPCTDGFWAALFKATESKEESIRYSNGVIENIEKIDCNVNSLPDFFGNDAFGGLLYPRLIQENRFLEALRRFKNADSEESKLHELHRLEDLVIQSPPRLLSFLDRANYVVGESSVVGAEAVLTTIQDARVALIKVASKQKTDAASEAEIWNWTIASSQ